MRIHTMVDMLLILKLQMIAEAIHNAHMVPSLSFAISMAQGGYAWLMVCTACTLLQTSGATVITFVPEHVLDNP